MMFPSHYIEVTYFCQKNHRSEVCPSLCFISRGEMFICPITGGIKIDQLDEEVHREKSGKVLSTGASVPIKLGCATCLAHRCVHQL